MSFDLVFNAADASSGLMATINLIAILDAVRYRSEVDLESCGAARRERGGRAQGK